MPRVRIAQLDLTAPLPFPAVFDLVLVDAPCSGLGTIRREPEIRWRRTAEDLARFADQQQRMLSHAAAGVRPGGRLVYATCSSEPEENEAVAAAFLADHPGLPGRLRPRSRAASRHHPGDRRRRATSGRIRSRTAWRRSSRRCSNGTSADAAPGPV